MTALRPAIVATDREALLGSYRAVRAATEALAAPLGPEDQVVQSMPDVSPTKWHRAHTTWFFETFLLQPSLPGYESVDPRYGYLFNSYYEAAGARHPRPQRGLLSRPTVAEVSAYRERVDVAMASLITGAREDDWTRLASLVELGLNHEQQHQELLLMDIKHVLSCNPFDPAYAVRNATVGAPARAPTPPTVFVEFAGGLVEIGHDGAGFAFDNEGPRHTVYLEAFRIADRLVTAGDWIEFIDNGGYTRPDLWLSDGWYAVQDNDWRAPLYWRNEGDGHWTMFTLAGRRPIDPAEPVVHVSHYEADAYARWAGARLPTEFEWEHAGSSVASTGHFLGTTAPEDGLLHPRGVQPHKASTPSAVRQMFGDVWEWTASAYVPYPRFTPAPGAVGEYNGKFMSGQMVLRGGSCITPEGHVRVTYRNFFYPANRWMFGGVRLAADA